MAIASTNAALSIQRMASRETSSLAVAQMLVARHNGELDHELTQQRTAPDANPQSQFISSSEVEEALSRMERRWDQSMQVGRLLDKTV